MSRTPTLKTMTVPQMVLKIEALRDEIDELRSALLFVVNTEAILNTTAKRIEDALNFKCT